MLSVESRLREENQQLLDTLARLEADKKQVVADFEKQINELKQQNQELRLENESLRTTANTPPAVVPQEDNMADPTFTMVKMALKFNLATDDRDLDEHEVEVLCRTLCNAQSLSILERFVEDHDIRPSDLAYCIDGVVREERFPVAFFGESGTKFFHLDELLTTSDRNARMPKITAARRRYVRYEPYDHSFISHRRATNKRNKKLEEQLKASKAEELFWKREYKLSRREICSLKKHVKRLLDDFKDRGKLQEQMALIRLRMMNLGM
ncbi:hypothetical protein NW768_004063 [Fusarium equiseti]|uniref:BZIP domain-containing protein n=1 Tax=Fusarium equiseti TaxID=61235 RepID=A0ABQ8RJD5_FUSEQ|nr:hypothetical protein NW768_004063 [Fusarium equiseti]